MLRSETIFLSARDSTLFDIRHKSSTPHAFSRRGGRGGHTAIDTNKPRGRAYWLKVRVCRGTQPLKCSRNECSMDAAMVLGGIECVRESEKGTGVFTRQVGSCEEPSDNCTVIYTAPVKFLSGYSVY